MGQKRGAKGRRKQFMGMPDEMSDEAERAAATAKWEAKQAARRNAATRDNEATDSDNGDDTHTETRSKPVRLDQYGIPITDSEDDSDGVEEVTQARVDPSDQLTRKEREELKAQKEAREYQKRHAAGETEEARADLARLKLVREKREADAAKRKAEAEAKAAIRASKGKQ